MEVLFDEDLKLLTTADHFLKLKKISIKKRMVNYSDYLKAAHENEPRLAALVVGMHES